MLPGCMSHTMRRIVFFFEKIGRFFFSEFYIFFVYFFHAWYCHMLMPYLEGIRLADVRDRYWPAKSLKTGVKYSNLSDVSRSCINGADAPGTEQAPAGTDRLSHQKAFCTIQWETFCRDPGAAASEIRSWAAAGQYLDGWTTFRISTMEWKTPVYQKIAYGLKRITPTLCEVEWFFSTALLFGAYFIIVLYNQNSSFIISIISNG